MKTVKLAQKMSLFYYLIFDFDFHLEFKFIQKLFIQYVIEGITWAEKQLLEAVGLHEPPVEKLRQQCTEYINSALIPLKAYAKQYERFMELIILDIPTHLNAYESKNPSALEIKQKIEECLEESENVMQIIPSFIIIGPFYVNAEPVRQSLSKKHKALASAFLELLTKLLRKQTDS
ncbi:unnamed protein product, partial [Schistosoma turkestanicum]